MTKISDAAIADYAVGAGFPKVAVPTAVAVALAESEGDPSATHLNSDVHKSTDYGLWQINGYWWADILRRFSPWSDPAQNARMAVTVWKDSRWSFDPWNTYKHGSHLKFMDRARAAYPATWTSHSRFGRSATCVEASSPVCSASSVPTLTASTDLRRPLRFRRGRRPTTWMLTASWGLRRLPRSVGSGRAESRQLH
jgi:hypothetical protein